jgi:hypothetical protein
MAAAASTVAVIPAAADEVSASIAHLFSGHAQGHQALAGQAAAFHEQFVQHLNASARSYAAAEAANSVSLQHLNASAGSSASAIAALPGPLLNLLTSVNVALGQLLNTLTSHFLGFLNALYDIIFYAQLIAYSAHIIAFLAHIVGYFLVQFLLLRLFGV